MTSHKPRRGFRVVRGGLWLTSSRAKEANREQAEPLEGRHHHWDPHAPALGSTGRACPDVRAATVSTVVRPRPSFQSLLDSSRHSVRLAQGQAGRSRLALARRREDLTALQQQLRAVSIERSAAAVLIDQAGDLRRALLRDHEHASKILRCLHVAARLIEQHVVDNVLFDPGAENGDELVTTVRTATEAATAMCGAINAAGHALTSTAASLASEEHLLSTARTSSGVCRRFLDAAAAAGDQLLADVVDEHTPPAAGRAPLRLLRSPEIPGISVSPPLPTWSAR